MCFRMVIIAIVVWCNLLQVSKLKATQPTILRSYGCAHFLHKNDIEHVRFANDNDTVVVAARRLFFWSISKRQVFRKIGTGNSTFCCFAFSADNKRVAVGDRHGDISVWHIQNNTRLLEIQGAHNRAIQQLIFTRDDRIISTSYSAVKLWHSATGNLLEKFDVGSDRICSMAFATKANRLAIAGLIKRTDKSTNVVVLNANNGKEICRPRLPQGICRLAFSSDGRWLAVGCGDKVVRVFDLNRNQLILKCRGYLPPDNPFGRHTTPSVMFSKDKRRLLAWNDGQIIYQWSTANGKRLKDIVVKGYDYQTIPKNVVDISPNSKTVVVGGGDNRLCFYEAKSGRQVEASNVSHHGPVDFLNLNEDGGTLYSGSSLDRTIRKWDLKSGKHNLLFTQPVTGEIGVYRNGDIIVSSNSKSVDIWDTRQKKKYSFQECRRGLASISYSEKAKLLACHGCDGVLMLWDCVKMKGTILARPKGTLACQPISISRDGRILAVGERDRSISIWDTIQKTKAIQIRPGLGATLAINVSNKDRKLFAGFSSGWIAAWNLASGKLLYRKKGHEGPVLSVCLSNDRLLLATGGEDGIIRLWNTKNGILQCELTGHIGSVRSLIFLPEPDFLASGGEDRRIILWKVQR